MDCIKMVVTMNPCPCGCFPAKSADYEIIKYSDKISGYITDRMIPGKRCIWDLNKQARR